MDINFSLGVYASSGFLPFCIILEGKEEGEERKGLGGKEKKTI